MRRTKIVMGLATVSLVISGIATVGCSNQTEQGEVSESVSDSAQLAETRGWQTEGTLAKACEKAEVEPFIMPARFTAGGIEFGKDVRYWYAGCWVMAQYEAEGNEVLVTKWPTATHQGEVMGIVPNLNGMVEWKASFDGTNHVYHGPHDNAVRVAEWEDEGSQMSYLIVCRETKGSGDFSMTDAEAVSIITGIED